MNTCDEASLLDALSGGGKVTFKCSGTITLSLPITVSTNTTINGDGHDITISGAGAVAVFTVLAGAELDLKNLAIAEGSALWGGAVNNAGTLNLLHCTLRGNNATFFGGAIANFGSLSVTESTFSGNSAPGTGGGAIVNSGTALVKKSTFVDNTGYAGGAIDNNFGSLKIVNSTFYGNSTPTDGGALLNDATETVINSTFAHNSAASGGGIENGSDGTLRLENTIVANSPAGGNCSGAIKDGGGNLSSDDSCPGIHNENPLLGPLEDNGGPTETMALKKGSPAIDAAVEAHCPATDQRGVPRPQGPRCDIGAYERASVPRSGTTCETFYNDTFYGDIVVKDGQTCGFVSGGVHGDVEVRGGNLLLLGATVTGQVTIQGGTFRIGPGTGIDQDLKIEDISAGEGGPAPNQVCGAKVEGDLFFKKNGTAVEIGSASSECPGNTIGGDLGIWDNTARTTILDNTVEGDLEDDNNKALTEVVGNTVKHRLQCYDNRDIVGGPNTAREKSGQCY
ncbi:MAG: right-handed parallel beta-helix repeat-containing protein [Bryobacteraceae bacterium]